MIVFKSNGCCSKGAFNAFLAKPVLGRMEHFPQQKNHPPQHQALRKRLILVTYSRIDSDQILTKRAKTPTSQRFTVAFGEHSKAPFNYSKTLIIKRLLKNSR